MQQCFMRITSLHMQIIFRWSLIPGRIGIGIEGGKPEKNPQSKGENRQTTQLT
jgi:hypothetical protein